MFNIFSHAISQILDVIAEPRSAAKRIARGDVHWLALGLSVCALSVCVQVAQVPMVLARVPQNVPPGLQHQIHTWLLLAVLLHPVVFAVHVAVVAYALWIGAAFLDLGLDFARCLTITIGSQVVGLLHQAVLVGVGRFQNPTYRWANLGSTCFYRGMGCWCICWR